MPRLDGAQMPDVDWPEVAYPGCDAPIVTRDGAVAQNSPVLLCSVARFGLVPAAVAPQQDDLGF